MLLTVTLAVRICTPEVDRYALLLWWSHFMCLVLGRVLRLGRHKGLWLLVLQVARRLPTYVVLAGLARVFEASAL